MGRKKVLLSGLLLAAVVGLGLFFRNEANWYAITSGSGSINAGSRFGVSVGDDIGAAKARLEGAGFRQVFSPSELDELNYPIRGEYAFSDRGWRRGVVWLKVSGDVVTTVRWHYQLGAP
jgi:hypothetical protein